MHHIANTHPEVVAVADFAEGQRAERPETSEEAVEAARARLAEVPKMVPLYGHRFLPAGRGTFAQPVMSMRGWDIIYYGTDLLDYIGREFEEPRSDPPADWNPQATVPFWRDYL